MSERKRILHVHVGPPKTGTSAIQHYFAGLNSGTITYPTTGRWPDGSHNMLTFALAGTPNWGAIEIEPLPKLIRALSHELEAARGDVLISSEGFADPQTYRKFLARFEGPLARFDRIVPILVLRHPVERVASLYNQAVKDAHLGETLLPDAYLERHISEHRLMPQVNRWRSNVSPETRFLPYAPAGTLLARFCALLDQPAPEASDWRNRSLGGVGLALCLIGNRHLRRSEARQGFLEALRADGAIRLWHGPSFPFSAPATERALQDVVKRDVAALFAQTGIDARAWERPDTIRLSDADRNQIRAAAATHLPDSAAVREDVDRVIATLGGASD